MNKSCLVVDDSRLVRKIASQIIQSLGFEVSEAENGLVAMERCAISMPDVVLLDWNMPVLNGVEFLRQLRRMENGAATHVVFCTTESDVYHIQEALEAGADEYVIKPFDSEVLRAKLMAPFSQ